MLRVFLSLILLSLFSLRTVSAAIHYDDWGPVTDRTKEEVGKIISRRFSEANFGEVKKGLPISMYKKCENKADCLTRYGTIYDLGAPKTTQYICGDAKWFGGHLDCIQGYYDKLYRDIKILEGEEKRLTPESEEYATYEKLLQEKLRVMQAMGEYQEGLIKKYIRDVVYEGSKLPYEFISFSGDGFDIDLGNGTENTPGPGGVTSGDGKKAPRLGLRKGTPCSAASPWNCHPDQLGNGSGSGDLQGTLLCPVPAAIKKCTPSQGGARDWAKNGETDTSYLQIQEKYCLEKLLQSSGNRDLLQKFRNGQDDAYRSSLIDLYFVDGIDQAQFEALYQGIDSARGRKREMIACRYLSATSPDNAEVQSTISPMIQKVELEDANITPFVMGMGKIIQNDLGRELGLFAVKTKALALMALSYMVKPELTTPDRVAMIVEKFASCDEMSVEDKNSLQKYLEDQSSVLDVELNSSATDAQAFQKYLSSTNAGLIYDIDRVDPHFFDGYVFDLERPAGFQEKIKSYFESQLEAAKISCQKGLSEEGLRASTSSSMVANFFKCGDNPTDCHERKRFGWALCGLFESAVQAGKTNDDQMISVVTALDSPLFASEQLPLMRELGRKLGLSQQLEDNDEAKIHLAMRALQQFKLEAGLSVQTNKPIVLASGIMVSAWINPGSRVGVGLKQNPSDGPYLYIDIAPPLKVRVGPITKDIGRIYYKFKDAEFALYLNDYDLPPGTDVSTAFKLAINAELNASMRPRLPREWQVPGYDPYKDANPDRIMKDALKALSYSSGAGPSLSMDDFSNVNARAGVKTFRAHRYNFGTEAAPMALAIDDKTNIQLNLTTTGPVKNSALKSLEVSMSPKLRLGDVEADGTFKDNGFIEISKITFLPGGEIKAEYTIPAENKLGAFATGGVGLFLLFDVAATGNLNHAQELANLDTRVKLDTIRADIDKRINQKLGPMLRDFVLKNKDIVSGMDLETFMGLQ